MAVETAGVSNVNLLRSLNNVTTTILDLENTFL